MKKLLFALTALLLLCAGCGAPTGATSTSGEADYDRAWRFEVGQESYVDEYKSADGTLLCTCSYEYPVLRLLDDGGNPHPGTGAEAQIAACEEFNAYFRPEGYADSFADLRQIAASSKQGTGEYGLPYSEEQNITSLYQTDALVSVEYDFYTYTGGAHGYGGRDAVNFDPERGVFFNWTKVSDDEAALRKRLGNEVDAIILRDDMAGALFDDYQTHTATLEYACCAFDAEGVRITFPESVLGPHAAGLPSFHVPYEAFEDLLNEWGAQLLGRG